jgi:hypothetical protein
MKTAIIKISDNKFSLIRSLVRELNGKIRVIDEDSIREEILAKLANAPESKEEIVDEELIRKDFKKHGIDLYR